MEKAKIHRKSQAIIKDLYSNDNIVKTEEGKLFEIPVEGSLGLLTLGYRGIIAWRKKNKI
jgi:hypothetical protein